MASQDTLITETAPQADMPAEAVNVSCQCLIDLLGVTHFHFNFQILAFRLAVFFGCFYGLRYAAGKVYMIILDEDHVEEAYAVIFAATDFNCLFFQQTHAGRGFAGVKHLGFQSLQLALIACGSGGYSAHPLHDIEHGALRL